MGARPKRDKTTASNSAVYREAEIWLVEQLMLRYARAFISPLRLKLATTNVRVEIDAATPDRTLLVEIWSHIGEPHGEQPTKIIADAAKLRWVQEELKTKTGLNAKVVIVAGDCEAIAKHASGNGWRAWGLEKDGIDIVVFPFPKDIREAIEKWLAERSEARKARATSPG